MEFFYASILAISASVAGGTLLARATEHLRVDFRDAQTVGQLAEYLLANETMKLKAAPDERWSREQVRAVVRAIIVDKLNVQPTFSDDASFVDDLGAD
jgi:hypothetical protein